MVASIFPLLRLLSDGQFHCSDEICKILDYSPDQLSEALDSLKLTGLEVKRNGPAGCRLTTPFSPLDAAQIERYLGGSARVFTIEVVDETGSTNEDLLLRARQGAPHGLVRVAETQTAGRGRRQRKWLSAPGGTLTFSLLWNFATGSRALSGLPLAVGVSIARSLGALKLQGVQLKWPNDILYRQGKLGGILIETAAITGDGVCAVIGVGLNVRLPDTVAERIGQPVADLDSAGLRIGRNELLAQLLRDLNEVLAGFSRDGFTDLRDQWQRLHAHQDKMVTIEMSDGTQLSGRATGVDEHGALLVLTAEGERTIYSGELSLRVADKPEQ
jgi:BirA family biotin operon repressor/biotin-[acetyl-CoA-carboxylase] ligase